VSAVTKRRPGPDLGGAAVADPRPRVEGDRVRGARCAACGYPTAPPAPWCPACHATDAGEAWFGPGGTVWSSTVVHIPVGKWTPPYAIAYVDLDDGPRVLAHLVEPRVLRPGARVRVAGATDSGDVLAAEASR
jgi:uncharacterized OB-fold protein